MIKYWVIKHLILLKIRNIININAELLQWSINVLIERTSGGSATLSRSETLGTRYRSAIKSENSLRKQLAEEIHKPIIRKFKKEKDTYLL